MNVCVCVCAQHSATLLQSVTVRAELHIYFNKSLICLLLVVVSHLRHCHRRRHRRRLQLATHNLFLVAIPLAFYIHSKTDTILCLSLDAEKEEEAEDEEKYLLFDDRKYERTLYGSSYDETNKYKICGQIEKLLQ